MWETKVYKEEMAKRDTEKARGMWCKESSEREVFQKWSDELFCMLAADRSCEMRNRKVSIGFVKLEIIGDSNFCFEGGMFGGESEIDVE